MKIEETDKVLCIHCKSGVQKLFFAGGAVQLQCKKCCARTPKFIEEEAALFFWSFAKAGRDCEINSEDESKVSIQAKDIWMTNRYNGMIFYVNIRTGAKIQITKEGNYLIFINGELVSENLSTTEQRVVDLVERMILETGGKINKQILKAC